MKSADVIPVETLQQSVHLGITLLGMTVPLKRSERTSDSQEQHKAVLWKAGPSTNTQAFK